MLNEFSLEWLSWLCSVHLWREASVIWEARTWVGWCVIGMDLFFGSEMDGNETEGSD